MRQFSLRQLLIGLAVVAVGCAVLAEAVQDRAWAVGAVVAVGSVGVFFLASWLLAGGLWCLGRVLCYRQFRQSGSWEARSIATVPSATESNSEEPAS